MSGPDALPPSARRLFVGDDESELLSVKGRGRLVARLLEDGTGEELAWLFARQGEAAVAAWVAAHAHRRLSRRSRAFWMKCLAVESPPAPRVAEALWPL